MNYTRSVEFRYQNSVFHSFSNTISVILFLLLYLHHNLFDITLCLKEDDPDGIDDEEEEEECAQYPEEGVSEDEANPEDIDDPESNLIVDEVEHSEEDSVSITQVERVQNKHKKKKKVGFSGRPDENENDSSNEEEELRVAAINNAIGN